MGSNFQRMLRILDFHIVNISSRKNMGPNELKNLTVFVEVTNIFIFSIQIFVYISRHSFGVLKTLTFGTLK